MGGAGGAGAEGPDVFLEFGGVAGALPAVGGEDVAQGVAVGAPGRFGEALFGIPQGGNQVPEHLGRFPVVRVRHDEREAGTERSKAAGGWRNGSAAAHRGAAGGGVWR